MNHHEQSDPILRALRELHGPEPSAEFDREVLSRCHAALARQRRRQARVIQARGARERLVDMAMAAAIGAYGASAAVAALWLAFVW